VFGSENNEGEVLKENDMAGIWPNGLNCEAGDVQSVQSVDGAKADATLVVGERYRIFAPVNGVTVIGLATPLTVGNIIGVIPPGGFLDYKATATTLMIACIDTGATLGTSFDGTAYVVKISDNA